MEEWSWYTLVFLFLKTMNRSYAREEGEHENRGRLRLYKAARHRLMTPQGKGLNHPQPMGKF